MKKLFNKKSIVSGLGALVFIFVCGTFAQTFAQDRYTIEQAQQAVRDKIVRSKGGEVTFPNYGQAQTYYISNSKTGVRGNGTWRKNYNSASQDFSYDARVENNNGRVDKIDYKFSNDNTNNGQIPSWAIGTFYGRNPQNGGTITLNIRNNGSVSIAFDNNAASSYATMSGDRLNNDGIISRVTKINNGIRTTRLDNGESIDYFYTNNNGNNNGGNVPNWAIGTFYSRNPQTGGNITLSISSNGSVVINSDGSTSYARMNGDRLNNDGIIARVTKINNGIRTTRIDNGERIDYYKNNNNDNNDNNNGGGNIPSWAIGTFYSRNPQTGGTITLTINEDGSVVIDSDGNRSYATMKGDRLNNGGIEAKVTKVNNGIRTTRTDNGERIDYRRQDY